MHDWIPWLLIAIVVLLRAILKQLKDTNPGRSHAEWDKGKWNGRP